MSSEKHLAAAGKPKIVPRRSSKKGSFDMTTYEFPAMIRPRDKTLRELIYDREKGKVFGRTPKNWGELILFYTIFYIALGALFAICMKGLMSTINAKSPTWILEESLIGVNPGLGFRPMPAEVDQGSLIWYDASNQTQISEWTSILDDFMEEYSKGSLNQKNCDFESMPGDGQVCKLDISKFDVCTNAHAYGYNNSSPCIFLKLNRIYGWQPEYYNDPEDLPLDMPDELQADIRNLPPAHRNQIWVTCRGENGADREIIGDIEYYPTRGFPSYFYPYTNTKGYLSPLVAVKFTRPLPNQIINIECRAWAKNIKYVGSHRDRQGSVHMELMIDAPLK